MTVPTGGKTWILTMDRMIPATRVILGLAGLGALWGFQDLVIRAWPPALPPALISLVPLGLGVFCLVAAITGPACRVTVDPATRTIQILGKASFLPHSLKIIAFHDVTTPEIVLHTDSDGPDMLVLQIRVTGRRHPVSLRRRREAERPDMEHRLSRLLADLQS